MDQAAESGRDNLAPTRCMGCMSPDAGGEFCPSCGWRRSTTADSILHLAPGTLLHNSYLVGRVLGQGGFGITYLGWDLQLQRKVAIKEYFPQSIASRQTNAKTVCASVGNQQADFEYGLQSFMSEGRVLARFSDHPCIVSVLTLFEENNTGYLIMAYLDGITLAQSLAEHGGRLPYDTVVETTMRVMDGLREVHAQGLLHRDISPDNIYLTRQGPVKILDFGAARMAVAERSQSLSVILKEGYAPEEQYRRSGKQGPWTDVYATAATLYRCITGITPPSSPDRLHADSLKSPLEFGVFIPQAAESALMRALSVSAGARFQSIEAFQSALITGNSEVAPPPAPESVSYGPPSDQSSVRSLSPSYTLYDPSAVGLATFLGSPVAGGVVMAINYRRMGEAGNAVLAVVGGVFLTGLGALIGTLLPSYGSLPVAIGLYYAMKGIAQSVQGPAVEKHVVQDGVPSGSMWSAAGIGLAFLAVFVAIIFGLPYADGLKNPKVIVGTKDQIFYKGSATPENAEALGAALKKIGYLQDRGVGVVLSKDPNNTLVAFIVKEGVWDRPDMIDAFEEIGRQIAPSVGGFPIHVQLINLAREVQKDLVVGRVVVGTKDEIYYFGTESESEARAAGEAFRNQKYLQDNGASVLLAKNGGATTITLVVTEGSWASAANVEAYREIVRGVAPSVGGMPIELRLMNTQLELKKTELVK